MDKRLLLLLGIAGAVIAVAILVRQPAPEALEVSNFRFSETSSAAEKFVVTKSQSTITFEGPVQKPTPCSVLNASYQVLSDTVLIDIKSAPYKGICIQVIADTFYKGSFNYAGPLKQVIVNYEGKELGRESF